MSADLTLQPSPPTATAPLPLAVDGGTLVDVARTPSPASDLGPCESCGSSNVIQIRTSRRNVELPMANGFRVKFRRLYLDRCTDCRHVVMSGKTSLGAFTKHYLPSMAEEIA